MVYHSIKYFAFILLKLWNRLEITGMENVPREGKLLIVANHASVVDPVAMGVSIPRPIRFMAKKELFEMPLLKGLIPKLGAFPVNRDKTDFQSVKNSLKVLANQEVLGMFPQGGTNKRPEQIKFRTGAAAIALKSKSPVLPVAIIGTDSVLRVLLLGKLRVHIGDAIYWPRDYQGKLQENDVARLTEEMEKAVQYLKSV